MMWVIYLASFVSSRAAEIIVCGLESLLGECNTCVIRLYMLDFQHKQTA